MRVGVGTGAFLTSVVRGTKEPEQQELQQEGSHGCVVLWKPSEETELRRREWSTQ